MIRNEHVSLMLKGTTNLTDLTNGKKKDPANRKVTTPIILNGKLNRRLTPVHADNQ